MAAIVNLAIDQGTTFRRVLTINDGEAPPVPINVTGYTFRSQARSKVDSTTVAFSFSFSIRTQTGGDVGKVDMSLAASVTQALVMKAPTSYLYDVEMVEGDGTIRRLFQGTITVNPEITR